MINIIRYNDINNDIFVLTFQIIYFNTIKVMTCMLNILVGHFLEQIIFKHLSFHIMSANNEIINSAYIVTIHMITFRVERASIHEFIS